MLRSQGGQGGITQLAMTCTSRTVFAIQGIILLSQGWGGLWSIAVSQVLPRYGLSHMLCLPSRCHCFKNVQSISSRKTGIFIWRSWPDQFRSELHYHAWGDYDIKKIGFKKLDLFYLLDYYKMISNNIANMVFLFFRTTSTNKSKRFAPEIITTS